MKGYTYETYNRLHNPSLRLAHICRACAHIAAAGYTDVAVFANAGQIPVRSDSTDAEIVEARNTAAAAGLTPSMLIGSTKLNLGLEAAVDDYKRLIDNAAALGTKWLLDCGTGMKRTMQTILS